MRNEMKVRGGLVELAMVVGLLVGGGARGQTVLVPGGTLSQGQGQNGDGEQAEIVTVVRGRVLNSVTKMPVARALVTLGEDAAGFTDDRGQFELKTRTNTGPRNGARRTVFMARSVTAKKPGYLEGSRSTTTQFAAGEAGSETKEVTIYLVPEALIVGHVEVPGTKGEVRIECELYRKTMEEGQETWRPSGTFTTWANGEYRFSNLKAGRYKLITHEEMDRDSMVPRPGVQLFGYPPIYYPNTTDFSAATTIVVKAGETAQANLTVVRRAYYPVRIEIANAPAGGPINLTVYPMGHHSPGWSLGYNPGEGTIEGMLPDGNYTVEAHALGGGNYSVEPNGVRDAQSGGILNFSVRGRPLIGPTLSMVPIAPITVNVHEEFQAQEGNTGNGGIPLAADGVRRYGSGLYVRLKSTDDITSIRTAVGRQLEGSDGKALVIEDAMPGHYRVDVRSAQGYAASIESGGVDLLKQPLVVGWGGGTPPIEVTVRNDGATVTGTVEQAAGSDPGNSQQSQQDNQGEHLYLLPLDGNGQIWQNTIWNNTNFTFEQVPPGRYLLLAYEAASGNALETDADEIEATESKGKVVDLVAGQTVNVNVKAIPANEGNEE
ncbi:MAG: hypothetical protein WBQ61_07725 [Candidatus Acidiferrum sp.]